MKNFRTLILSLLLVLSLAFVGCGLMPEIPDSNNEPPVEPVVSINISDFNLNMEVGDSYTLVVSVNPSNATDKSLTWTSSDTSVVTVNNGTVTAIG